MRKLRNNCSISICALHSWLVKMAVLTSASLIPLILDEIVREMGFTKLKLKQLDALLAVMSGTDTLCPYLLVMASQLFTLSYCQTNSFSYQYCGLQI